MVKRVLTQTFGVVGAIIEKNGKILLVKESQKKKYDHGKWSHPAGWIEVGENPLEAVKREVLEEAGYVFKPTHILGIYSLVRKDIGYKRLFPHAIKMIFIGSISGRQHKLEDDVSETRWFAPEEIAKMNVRTLRDIDIRRMVRDYFNGKKFPLGILHHTISTKNS